MIRSAPLPRSVLGAIAHGQLLMLLSEWNVFRGPDHFLHLRSLLFSCPFGSEHSKECCLSYNLGITHSSNDFSFQVFINQGGPGIMPGKLQ